MINRFVNRAALVLLGSLFVVFPWFHGLDLKWEQVLAAACISIFFALSVLSSSFHFKGSIRYVLIMFAAWLLYAALYLIPLPATVTDFLSPHMSHWYTLNGQENEVRLSVYYQASLIEWIKFLGIALLLPSVWLLCHSEERLHKLIIILVTGCTITALYSLLNFFSGGQFELVGNIPPWDLKWQDGIRGTFSYKNQYALYIAFGIALSAGVLADNIRSRRNRMVTVTLILTLIVLTLTLINTSSRGVIVALAGGSGLAGAMFLLRHKSLVKEWLSVKRIAAGAVMLLAAAVLFMQSSVYDRFAHQKMADNGRMHLRNTAISVISDHPVTGTGPGTYPYIQHVYKPMALGISKMSKRAHNDYLETMATTGIVGFLILAMPLGYMLWRIFRPVDCAFNGLLTGCRAAIATYLIQAAYDTNAGIYFLPLLFITVLTAAFVLCEKFAVPGSGIKADQCSNDRNS